MAATTVANEPRELAVEHAAGGLQRLARRQARLEVGAHGEAHERGVRQRLAPVPGDVADDHREATVLEREHVVEVAAGARAVGRAVGDGGADRAEPRGRHGQQRGLQQADVLEQLPALAHQPPRAHAGQARAHGERERERDQRGDQDAHGRRHDADDARDRFDDAPAARRARARA